MSDIPPPKPDLTDQPEHKMPDFVNAYNFPFNILYGWRWNGADFDPLLRNIQTGAPGRPHHARGEGARKREHFDPTSSKCEYAFCLNWITVIKDGSRFRTRCGEVIRIRSQGCATHPLLKGKDENPNSCWKPILEGKGVEASLFEDHELKKICLEDTEVTFREQEKANAVAAGQSLELQIEAAAGQVSQQFIDDHWAAQAKSRKILRQSMKEQKAAAAVSKKTAMKNGKFATVATNRQLGQILEVEEPAFSKQGNQNKGRKGKKNKKGGLPA